jgi:methylphosphotriester-DNA--protein-cysteine methyltransferase
MFTSPQRGRRGDETRICKRCHRQQGTAQNPNAEEVTDMTTLELSTESVEELTALWDRLREEAISDSDRHEIDEIFARQMP